MCADNFAPLVTEVNISYAHQQRLRSFITMSATRVTPAELRNLNVGMVSNSLYMSRWVLTGDCDGFGRYHYNVHYYIPRVWSDLHRLYRTIINDRKINYARNGIQLVCEL